MFKKTKYNSKKIVRYPNGRTKDYEELKEMALYSDMDKKGKKKWLEKVKEKCIIFDSKKEYEYYEFLLTLEKNGVIFDIRLQPSYILQPKNVKKSIAAITYKADFLFVNIAGELITVDIKGMPTEVAKIKRKLFLNVFPDKELRWIVQFKGNWVYYFENEKRKAVNRKEKKARNG